MKGLRRGFVVVVKLAVAAALLYWAFHNFRLHDYADSSGQLQRGFITIISQSRWWLLPPATLCFLAPILILSIRWWYLLRIQQIHLSIGQAVRLTFLGTFFNYVVPGTVSGDLVKAYYVARHTHRTAAVLVSVFVDRVVGLVEFAILPVVVMGGMLLAGAITPENFRQRFFWPVVVVGVVLAGSAVFGVVLLSPRVRGLLHLRQLAQRLPLGEHLAVAAEAANVYRSRLPSLAKALGVTLGGQAFFITGVMLCGLALRLPVPAFQYFLYVPLIYIIAAVPISPGGLGVAENCYLLFLGGFAGSTEILALAALARLLPMICSTPGLVVAMSGPHLPKMSQMQAQMHLDEQQEQADQPVNTLPPGLV